MDGTIFKKDIFSGSSIQPEIRISFSDPVNKKTVEGSISFVNKTFTKNDIPVAVSITCENRDSTIVIKPYRDWETDRKSTRLNSSHSAKFRMPSSA